MYRSLGLKDLEDIGFKIDVCTVANLYSVSIYTNPLEGDINAYFRIDSCEDGTMGGTVLFSVRSGEQICLDELSYEQQLVVPEDYLNHIRESISVELDFMGQKRSAWRNTITKLNNIHANDTNSNFEQLPLDLPVPVLKYLKSEEKEEPAKEAPIKKSLITRLREYFQTSLVEGND